MASSLKTTCLQGVSTTRQWHKLVSASQAKVEKIQRRIYRESQKGALRKVHSFQKLLSKSFSAKVIATNKVTNSGGSNTPGIDGMIYKTINAKISLVNALNLKNYKPSPTKHVEIPKPQGGTRKLGIPTIRDRAHQALVLLAMEPAWEARFEPNSYGFRPGRSAHHAVKCISDILHKNVKQYGGVSPKEKALYTWILDADISKCFDNINHKALLNKIHPSSPFLKTIQKWLQAGTITSIGFERTYKGTPQGGVISPLLANIALHGLEELFGIYTEKTKNECPIKKKYLPPSTRRNTNRWISLIRYADDFVVIVRADSDWRIKSYVLPKIRQFLCEIGLEINKAKTKIVNIHQGFTFLGFKFRFRKDLNNTTYWADKTRIDRSLRKLNDFVMGRKRIAGSEMPYFIASINRRIKGIINYYGWSRAWGIISYIGHRVWEIMYKWSLKRHPKRSKKWVRRFRFSHPPWETFVFNGVKVIIPYKYWRSITKARGWWGIKQIKIELSPFDKRWNN